MPPSRKTDSEPGQATADGRLYVHVASWPGRCIACQAPLRKGSVIVFRAGRKERWCTGCAAILSGEVVPSRAYLEAFGDDERARALRATARRPRVPWSASWREQVGHPRALRGHRVRIRRGAVILSDRRPRARRTVMVRAQVVKVHEVLIGVGASAEKPTTIRWAGAGGYLREVSVDDIEAIVE